MVDIAYNFIYIDASRKGSASNAQIYNSSDLIEGLERNLIIGFLGAEPLPNDTQNVPYFVGDVAFFFRTYFMKPCSSRYSHVKRSSTKRFLLANKFQILLTTI